MNFLNFKKIAAAYAVVAALAACNQSPDSALIPSGTPSAVDLVPKPSEVAPTSPTPAPDTVTLRDRIAQLEKTGQIPALDRTDSLLGTDANNNGVRDDIETYINSLGFTPAQVRAAMQDAKILQLTLQVDTNDPAAVQQLGEKSMASTKCLATTFIEAGQVSQVSNMLESKTMNTKVRVKQYLKYDAAGSGSVTRWPSGDMCDK